MIADHGEPPEYNELTYWSFRAFFNHLMDMGLIPRELKLVDGGTVLQDRYRDGLAVRIGYGIDPRIGGTRQGIAEAVQALVRRDRVRRIVVAYHGVGFSDVMQTHMLRHEIEHELERLDPSVTVSYAEPIGTSDRYVEAVVRKAHDELHRLSGHGLPTGKCGSTRAASSTAAWRCTRWIATRACAGITNASFGAKLKTQALQHVIADALGDADMNLAPAADFSNDRRPARYPPSPPPRLNDDATAP